MPERTGTAMIERARTRVPSLFYYSTFLLLRMARAFFVPPHIYCSTSRPSIIALRNCPAQNVRGLSADEFFVGRARRRQRDVRMDDEVARRGIKEELTTRDEYLATRFTKLSASGHDLTPLTAAENDGRLSAKAAHAGCHLSESEKAVLFDGAAEEDLASSQEFRDHREKGLYACSVGGLPLFTSGWKLDPRGGDDRPSFAEPCDAEHLLEEELPEEGTANVFCARSRCWLGVRVPDSVSPSGKRYLIYSAALEFHPLGLPLPVRSQPENYWGSEGQYRAWTFK